MQVCVDGLGGRRLKAGVRLWTEWTDGGGLGTNGRQVCIDGQREWKDGRTDGEGEGEGASVLTKGEGSWGGRGGRSDCAFAMNGGLQSSWKVGDWSLLSHHCQPFRITPQATRATGQMSRLDWIEAKTTLYSVS